MIQNKIWKKKGHDGPLVAMAIHNGYELREEVSDIMLLSREGRLREEDPFTEHWTAIGNIQYIATHSRFQVDLNRPREKAVYQKPEDAWGLDVWKTPPSPEIVARSLAEYDAFYNELRHEFSKLEKQFGHFIVFDLHSYNHRREGPNGPVANPQENPEVNLGTGTVNHNKWSHLIERFKTDLGNYNFNGKQLDVRENVKFKGGQLSRWTHQTFPDSACSISIEAKKFFMDEWTGIPDHQQIETFLMALKSTIPGVLEELEKVSNK
jgi:N-formylglutamate amidohydrolase